MHRVVSHLPRDAFPSIDDPTFGEIYGGSDDDLVLVIESATGPARAYPLGVIRGHEIVNDVLDSDPVAVTWCPLCNSAVVYDSRVDDEELTFGVSGKLADDDLVMYDRETGSEWKQSSGVCLSGPFEAERLSVRPAASMRWTRFREEFPDGVVLQPPPGEDVDLGGFEAYARSDRIGIPDPPGAGPGERTHVERWPFDAFGPKDLVIGVEADGEARAYPEPVVHDRGGVVTDSIGGERIVVFATRDGIDVYRDPGLSFESDGTGAVSADGTSWDPATGRSSDGRRLERMPARRMFAFTWRDDRGENAFFT